MNKDQIEIKEIEGHYQIGCRNCFEIYKKHVSDWRLLTDEKKFIAICRECNHVSELNKKNLVIAEKLDLEDE